MYQFWYLSIEKNWAKQNKRVYSLKIIEIFTNPTLTSKQILDYTVFYSDFLKRVEKFTNSPKSNIWLDCFKFGQNSNDSERVCVE